jgi:putative tryptophan/tyrosine transport system substrate-binding protein
MLDSKRREFIALIGGVLLLAAKVRRARAQQAAMPVIGFVYTDQTSSEAAPFITAFHQGLREVGFIEGQNVAVEHRWAGRQYDRLPALAAEMVHRRVAVIVGNSPPAMAAKTATSTIPIVFFSGTDPVKLGLVASFNRPGGNATGVSFWSAALEAKRLGLLHELLPQATVIAALVDPNFLTTAGQMEDLQNAARALGKEIQVLRASTESELDNGFATLAQKRPDALIVAAAPFFTARRKQLVALADRHRIAANLLVARVPCGRRPDKLRRQLYGCISPSWRLHRPHPQGREAGRPASAAAD